MFWHHVVPDLGYDATTTVRSDAAGSALAAATVLALVIGRRPGVAGMVLRGSG
jgi:hypothetical protein